MARTLVSLASSSVPAKKAPSKPIVKTGNVVKTKIHQAKDGKQASHREGQGQLLEELVNGFMEDYENDVDLLPFYNAYKAHKKRLRE